MIAFRHRVLSCVGLLACGLASAAPPAAAATAQAPDVYASIQRQPMIFFVAKGTPDACGTGCSEWIAAEGAIDAEAAKRLRDFLGALPRRDLPIFFSSTGGSARQAAALGRIMREHRMTAGVGRTLPEGCRQTVAIDDACRRVMQSKREHRARLVTRDARCSSACVYALMGASVRQVARDAQLGIHSVRIVAIPGRTQTGPAPKADDIHHLLKRYTIEMGVDSGLIDAAAKVSADRIRYLSRDEIAQFGIETRGFYETPWMPYEDPSGQRFVLKSITQAKGTDGKEYRTSNVRLWCLGAGFGMWFVYRRELSLNEIGVATAIRVAAGDGEIVLGREAIVVGREAKGGSGQRSARANWEFLQNAIAVSSIVITETFTPQDNAEGWSREVKLSINGLSKALEQLRKDCGEPNFIDAPAVKFLDVPGVPGGR
jgi:hypothetical protein